MKTQSRGHDTLSAAFFWTAEIFFAVFYFQLLAKNKGEGKWI